MIAIAMASPKRCKKLARSAFQPSATANTAATSSAMTVTSVN